MSEATPLASFPAGSLGVVIGASGAIGSALLGRLRAAFGASLAVGFSRAGSPSLDLTSEATIAAAARAIAKTRAMKLRPAPANVSAWHAHGRLTCAEAREASERAIVEVLLPCLELALARQVGGLGTNSLQPPSGLIGPFTTLQVPHAFGPAG